MLDRIVSAMLTGVFDLAPTKLYKVGTIHEIPNPTSIKPNELIMTFMTIESKVLPSKDKAARQLQDFLLSPKLICVIGQEASCRHHYHKYQKADLQ